MMRAYGLAAWVSRFFLGVWVRLMGNRRIGSAKAVCTVCYVLSQVCTLIDIYIHIYIYILTSSYSNTHVYATVIPCMRVRVLVLVLVLTRCRER